MSFLDQVSYGSQQTGQRIVLAGVEKSGKSTLMANAPRCLAVPMEMGLQTIRVHKTPFIYSFTDLISLLDEVKVACKKGTFKFKTLGFDTGTQLEHLIHKEVVDTDPDLIKFKNKQGPMPKNLTMESCHGAFGKGYALANQKFSQFTDYCDAFIRFAGLNIVVTCHVFPSRIVDPAYGEYDSWDLQLHSPKNNKTYGKREMITQWADLIGFIHEPFFVQKAEKGGTLVQAIGSNQGKMLGVSRTPGWVAGNRYGLTGSIAIPPPPVNPDEPYRNGWNSLANAIYSSKGIDVFNRDV